MPSGLPSYTQLTSLTGLPLHMVREACFGVFQRIRDLAVGPILQCGSQAPGTLGNIHARAQEIICLEWG